MSGNRTKERAAATVASNGAARRDPLAGLPRRPVEELDEMARAQGVPLEADVDSLVAPFWPAEESCDDFIAAYRGWRHAGRAQGR